MKKIYFLGLATFALMLTSCGETKKETVVESTPSVETTPPQTKENKTTNTAALNPEHGEPGHRCDIPVGAPLNSATQTNAAPTPAQPSQKAHQPFLVNNQAKQQNKGTANTNLPKLNPEHGQPGHRCDIPVGQPLS